MIVCVGVREHRCASVCASVNYTRRPMVKRHTLSNSAYSIPPLKLMGVYRPTKFQPYILPRARRSTEAEGRRSLNMTLVWKRLPLAVITASNTHIR